MGYHLTGLLPFQANTKQLTTVLLPAAFSRKLIISFHAACAFVLNELTDITSVSHT